VNLAKFTSALALAFGCSSAPPAPVVAPGQVIVDGDRTFRTGDRGAIAVTTHRDQDGAAADGVVVLHGMSLDDAKRSIFVRVAAGRAWLAIAHQLAASPEAAYGAAKRGIDELGSTLDLPPKPIIIDDTDNHVHIAEDQAEHGHFADAAGELAHVLETRIAIFNKKSRGAAE
jgi:hypothetical protein